MFFIQIFHQNLPFSLLLFFLVFVVALQVAGVVGRFRRLSRIKGVGRLYPPCWTLQIDISCAQSVFELDIYPFFGFLKADFVGDTEGVVILILPPVWHLK